MGNTSCLSASDVSDISDFELNRTKEQDELCVSLLSAHLPVSEIGRISQLNRYTVIGAAHISKTDTKKPEIEEIGFLCLQEKEEKLGEKFREMRTALVGEIRTLGEREMSSEKRLKTSQLQLMCRLHDALLRESERERRTLSSLSHSSSISSLPAPPSLPPLAQAGLSFSTGLLLQLVTVISADKPEIRKIAVEIAAAAVKDLKPLSVASVDPRVREAVDQVESFVTGISAAETDPPSQLKALTVILSISLAKGQLPDVLAIAGKLMLNTHKIDQWRAVCPCLTPVITNLDQYSTTTNQVNWTWAAERQGPDIVLSNGNLRVTRMNSAGWGCQKSAQKVSTGVHYVEFLVERNSSDRVVLGVAGEGMREYSGKCVNSETVCYQADGDTFCEGRFIENVGGFSQSDKIGFLLNMDDRTLTLFKNGVQISPIAYSPIPSPLRLIVCIGASEEYISINPSAVIPAEYSRREGGRGEVEGVRTAGEGGMRVVEGVEKVQEACFGEFKLDEIGKTWGGSRKIQRKNGLVVDVQMSTFRSIISILSTLKSAIETESLEITVAMRATISTLKILRNHVFAATVLKLTEIESGLDSEIKGEMKALLQFFVNFRLKAAKPQENLTKTYEKLQKETLTVSLHCFELFYPSFTDQFDFITNGLTKNTDRKPEFTLIFEVLRKICLPTNLSKCFSQFLPRFSQFLSILLDLSFEDTLKMLQNDDFPGNRELQTALFQSQTVLFLETSKQISSIELLNTCKQYTDSFFAYISRLLDVLKMTTSGKITDKSQKMLRNSMLHSHFLTLLRILIVFPLSPEFSAALIPETTRLISRLSDFAGGDMEEIVATEEVRREFESEHPYKNSAEESWEIRVDGAIGYRLEFDERCRSEENYDYLELYTDSSKSVRLFRWESDFWPKTPLIIPHPSLFFCFHSDNSTSFWGWKISIFATVPTIILQEPWAEEAKSVASLLMVALCRNLIEGREDKSEAAEVKEFMRNRLVRNGIRDTLSYRISKLKPSLSPPFATLIASTQTEESLPATKPSSGILKLSIFQSLFPRRLTTKPLLSAYLSQLAIADKISLRYCDISLIDELIAGSDRTEIAFRDLKKKAGLVGPISSLGGTEMDQAERAVFGVFLAYFDLISAFSKALEEPQDVNDILKFVLKQVNSVRQWGQLRIQRMTDATNREVTYKEVSKDIVEKCVLLLHTDYRQTVNEIGVENALKSLKNAVLAAPRKAGHERRISLTAKKRSSKWKEVRRTVEAMSIVKRLQGLFVMRNRQREGAPAEEDKKEVMKVFGLVMNVFNSALPVSALITSLQFRRTLAVSRSLGLTLLSQSSTPLNPSLSSLIPSAFSSFFLTPSYKRHYSTGAEGADPYLISCLQRSFFRLYQLLLDRIQLDTIRDLDCTSESGFSHLIDTLDALSFPFEDTDASQLLDLAMRETAGFLLSWAKGQRMYEKPPKVFERGRVVVDLRVCAEEEYKECAENEAFSLNIVNRLDGEVGEEVEGQQKLVLELIRGSVSPLLPITDVQIASQSLSLEGYDQIPGNINEIGEPLSLFLRREPPHEGGAYLTKVKVTGWCPIQLGFTYKSYASLMKVDKESEEWAKREERKVRLKRAAWVLFKLMLYSAAGRGEEDSSEVRRSRRKQLQELFAELLYPELKCLPRAHETDTSLDLKHLLSGKNWRTSEVPFIELLTSPVGEWVEKIKEDTKEYLIASKSFENSPKVAGVSLTDVVNEYISNTDPMMKGTLEGDELLEKATEIPPEYRNSKGQIDFFCFLRHVVAHSDTILADFWVKYVKQSPLYRNIPSDFYEAQSRLGEGSVASILSVFETTMHPNDTEDSFLPYIKRFREAETPGIIPKNHFSKGFPKEFLNEDRSLDFFVALKAIKEHPEEFPDYFKELKPLLHKYQSIPNSCCEFYKARLSESQAEYQASLLVLLYQCCNSKGMLGILGQPQWLMELLKHMLVGSLKSSNISFRLVREILLSNHSPDTFSPIWRSLPKAKLRAEFGNEVCRDLITVLFCFIGVHSSIHIKSWKYTFLTLEKIAILSTESISFLYRLANSDLWAGEIVNICAEYVSKGVEMTGSQSGSEILIGVLEFLSNFSAKRSKLLPEWRKVRLQNAGITEGILIQNNQKQGKMTLYCPEDDSLHTESVGCFLETVSERSADFLKKVPVRLVETLFGEVIKLISAFEDTLQPGKSSNPTDRLILIAVRKLVQNCAFEALISLCDTRKDVSIIGITDFTQKLIKSAGRDSVSDFNSTLYEDLRQHLYTRHRSKAASIVRTSSSLSAKGQSEESVLSRYSEEKKVLVNTLKSIGLEYADIKEAFDHGHFELESVLKYVETRSLSVTEKAFDHILVYKLSKNEKNPPMLRDNSGRATFYESPKGHLCLKVGKAIGFDELDEPKFIYKLFDEGIFANVESPPEELTLLVALGFLEKIEECTFGFIIGKISVTLKIFRESIESGAIEPNFFFRIFLTYNGHCTVFNDKTGEKVLESEDAFRIEEFSSTKFGVFLNSFGKVELKGLSMFLGHFTGSLVYWEDEPDQSTRSFGSFLSYRFAPTPHTSQALISTFGLPAQSAFSISRKHPDLKRSIATLISSDFQYTPNKLKSDFGEFVEDVFIGDRVSEVPQGYHLVQFFTSEGLSSDYSGYSGTVVGVKHANSRHSQCVRAFEWKHGKINVVKGEKSSANRVISIVIVRTANPMEMDLPPGYSLLCEDGLAINLTPYTTKCHFLAFRNQFYMRNHPFTSLGEKSKMTANNGLFDAFSLANDTLNTVDESIKFPSYSLFQLQLRVFALEKSRKSTNAFALITRLIERWTESITDGKQLLSVLELSGTNFRSMEVALNRICYSENMIPGLPNALLIDVISQLIKPAFAALSVPRHRKTIIFESAHPYANDFSKIEEIHLPGAQKLNIAFDSMCKSEENYDYLLFAKDKELVQEVGKFSGSYWENFEVEGDRLYFKFHTDATNTDWGYKFTVSAMVPISGKTYKNWDVERCLWILERLIFKNESIKPEFARFVGREMVNSMMVFIHTTKSSEETVRGLVLLKRILLMSDGNKEEIEEIVSVLAKEMFALYQNEISKPDKSDFLKTIFGLMIEIREKIDFSSSEDWFESLFDAYSFLKGIKTKDETFQFYLLKQFLEVKNRSLELTRESSHPYPFPLLSKEVYIRGADFLSVTFTKLSESEPNHCFYISKDISGLQPINFTPEPRSISHNTVWNTGHIGPNIEFSNENKSVTRTDSSGWGNAFLGTVLTSGKTVIKYRLDTHDGSGYLYMGVCGMSDLPLMSCLNKDLDYPLWVYKATGECHSQGFSREVRNGALGSGDILGIVVDMEVGEVVFDRNGEEVGRFQGVEGAVTGCVCFGGNNQLVTLVSVESQVSDPTNLSEMAFTVPGDRFFYHYPVNSGLLLHLNSAWRAEKRNFVTFANDNRTVSRSVGGEAISTRVYSSKGFKGGKQLMEIKITALSPGSNISFGLCQLDQPSFYISYDSDGTVKKPGETLRLDTYSKSDSIAFLYTPIQNEVKIYKNSTVIATLTRIVLDTEIEYFWGLNLVEGSTVEIVNCSKLVETEDLMGKNGSIGVAARYGYKFTASPFFRGKSKKFAFENLGPLESEWKSFLSQGKSLYAKEVCEQLVTYIDEKCDSSGKDPMSLSAEEINPNYVELLHYSLLEKLELDDIRRVFTFVKGINSQMDVILPFISLDLSEQSGLSGLQNAFLSLRGSLFLHKKKQRLRESLSKSHTIDRISIEINRAKAAIQRSKGLTDSQGVSSIFGQLYRQLHKLPNKMLRNEERVFHVNLKGEGAIDAGGPYNEVISGVCEELESKYLPLLVISQNGVQGIGEYRECWVPNPAADSSLHLDMFQFLGKFLGIAIRTQNALNLHLPPIFWKRLLHHETSTLDLKTFDECIYQTIDILRNVRETCLSPDSFKSAFDGETFTARDSGGRLVELIPGGRSISVTIRNATDFANSLEKQRLTESESIYESIRTGISAVIPLNLLFLFSWKQVETLVCGPADIDVALLRRNTVYEGLSEDSSVVKGLWEVLSEMTPKERSLFLRFVWGRCRLPSGAAFKRFTVTLKDVDVAAPDNYLPVSHTCFFTLDLPPYSSKSILRDKLLYAITHCQAIDLDRVAGAEGWDED